MVLWREKRDGKAVSAEAEYLRNIHYVGVADDWVVRRVFVWVEGRKFPGLRVWMANISRSVRYV